MEERNNRSNTMLLTVIAIATLLVVVIGATFAYFTAAIDTAETVSTVELQGTTLTIAFSDSNPSVGITEGLVPQKNLESVTHKDFSLTASNPSSATVKYTLYLAVTKNSFALKDNSGHTSLTYSLTATTNNGGEVSNKVKQNIPAYDLTNLKYANGQSKPAYTGGTDNLAPIQAANTDLVNSGANTFYLHGDFDNGNSATRGNGTEDGTQIYGINLGSGTIAARNNSLTHSYRLDIFFDENELNQDYDKNSEFNGYVAIDADAITSA